MNKKLFISAAVVVLLVLGGWLTYKAVKKTPPAIQNEEPKGFDPKNPNFIQGSVVSASAEKIEFKSSNVIYTTEVGAFTPLIKQVKEGQVYKNVSATISDFKTNSLIVVYFDSPPQNNIYKATRIQLIK